MQNDSRQLQEWDGQMTCQIDFEIDRKQTEPTMEVTAEDSCFSVYLSADVGF